MRNNIDVKDQNIKDQNIKANFNFLISVTLEMVQFSQFAYTFNRNGNHYNNQLDKLNKGLLKLRLN